MIDALLARASTRFVFVVGKGGVGKTTTAGAIALARADRSEQTHLISTDPAHSLGDLFGQELAGSNPVESTCTRRLHLEEFDARGYADAMFAELRAPLVELIERGTYLDSGDATGFLDLSIPGIDEVMSALRLVDLYDSGAPFVIVDTAPTGHTLRLLDADSVIESWVAAGRAISEKAAVVATHLVGRPVPLAADRILEALSDRARSFEQRVLRQGTALVVTRAGGVIAAETARLTAELMRRGVPVAASVSVGADGSADFAVERYDGARGCAGLRAWPLHLCAAGGTTPPPSRTTQSRPARAGVEDWVRTLGARLFLVAGKGGVGKSTCASALALALAQDRRTCIISTDPAGSLSEILAAPVGPDPVEVEPRLFARQIDAAAELLRMRELYRDGVRDVFERVGLETAAQLDRAVIESFFNFAPPGLDEIGALIQLIEQSGEYDALVVDSAPTGHFLRLIELPDIVLDWVHQLLRLLVKYHASASLDALANDLLAFAKRLRQLKLDLSMADRTAVFVVTLDHELVGAETARLCASLTRAGLPITALVWNLAASEPSSPANVAEPRAGARIIYAPAMDREIVGPDALRSFLGQWGMTSD